jgi:hypothetical protein
MENNKECEHDKIMITMLVQNYRSHLVLEVYKTTEKKKELTVQK